MEPRFGKLITKPGFFNLHYKYCANVFFIDIQKIKP